MVGKRRGVSIAITKEWRQTAQKRMAEMRAAGIRQETIARRVGISGAELSRILSGKGSNSSSFVTAISRVLDVPQPTEGLDQDQLAWLSILDRARNSMTPAELSAFISTLAERMAAIEESAKQEREIQEKKRLLIQATAVGSNPPPKSS